MTQLTSELPSVHADEVIGVFSTGVGLRAPYIHLRQKLLDLCIGNPYLMIKGRWPGDDRGKQRNHNPRVGGSSPSSATNYVIIGNISTLVQQGD